MTAPDTARADGPSARSHVIPGYTALALLIVALIVLLLVWDWNWFKRPIERYVEAKTGRHLVIGGNLDVHLGRTAVVQADALTFGNAAWSKVPEMARVDRLTFAVRLWPLLLHRDVLIPDIRLTRPRLLLERGPNDVGNWTLPSSGGKPAQFNQVWIDHGHLQYIDAPSAPGSISTSTAARSVRVRRPRSTSPARACGRAVTSASRALQRVR